MSNRFITDRDTRIAQLRMGLMEISLSPLWSRKRRFDPWWERLAACPFVFCMGPVNLFSAITSVYFGEAIQWLGCQHVSFKILIEDTFRVEVDPEMSKRIVDPRHRLAALDAIEQSMARARRKA